MILQHNDGHGSFKCQLIVGAEHLELVTNGRATELRHRKAQPKFRVELNHANEATLNMDAGKIVTHAAVHRPFNGAHEFALGFLHQLEDARKVQSSSRIGISPTQSSLEFYGSWHLVKDLATVVLFAKDDPLTQVVPTITIVAHSNLNSSETANAWRRGVKVIFASGTPAVPVTHSRAGDLPKRRSQSDACSLA